MGKRGISGKQNNWAIQIFNGLQAVPEVSIKTKRKSFTIKIKQRVRNRLVPVLEIIGDEWVTPSGTQTLTIQATPISNAKVQRLITLIEEPTNVSDSNSGD